MTGNGMLCTALYHIKATHRMNVSIPEPSF